jgi:hypothetical protein
VALLTFPATPFNGEIYPVSPPAGTNVYQWSSAEQTWVLLGKASGVGAGTYGDSLNVPQITIDATGRITFAQNVAIQQASTSQVGVVQLVDNTVTNDATKALTAAAGYNLQSQIGDLSLLNPPYPNLVTAINAAGDASGVTAGTYGSGTSVGRFTVNSQGRITAAQNVPLSLATAIAPGVIRVGVNLNVTGSGVLSVPNGTTTASGVVQLVNNTTTNDGTKALTAAAGYSLQQQIDVLAAETELTFAGTISATTGLMLTVTTKGALAGFASGLPLPAPSSSNLDYFVIVTVAGTFTPTGGTPSVCNVGDWFVSSGSSWVYFNVGPVPVPPPVLTFLDDLSPQFNGVKKNFTLRIGGAPYTPNPPTNVMLFIGGVPQLVGSAFTLTGANVLFSEAPLATATFVGITVK